MLIDFRKLFPKYGIKPKGVLHVGANVGEEAHVYDELGIKRVLWVEANPDIFEKLRDNISKYKDQLAVNECVSDVDNLLVDFHISNNGSQSSSILELGTHKTAHPEVHYVKDITLITKRIDTIFTNLFIAVSADVGVSRIRELAENLRYDSYDFINMDLQGAELKALRGMGDLLTQFKWAYLEVNKEELYKGCALVGEIDNYLLGFGFKRVETFWCGNTGWGDALYIKGR